MKHAYARGSGGNPPEFLKFALLRLNLEVLTENYKTVVKCCGSTSAGCAWLLASYVANIYEG